MSQAAATYFFTLYALVNDRFEDRKDRGATAVEYGLMVGLIAVVIIAVVGFLGQDLQGLFQSVRDGLAGAGGEN
ncbi:Flp family type IVb pilin [Dietzia sp. SLG310A2-38A2]|uniref:Flp family type IVb pilin n=1 Tax=Dietzia sp. SLG310A2-38A2 TaxID=1630643 RepID=UPI0015FB4684|nr:Flp family type IVb pilin [Dietzia sp. SLG310A2-38A2]MBB1032143.1 Flp family type IVb pilin [Dietzia sp. SLG310A2-38A2]